MTLTIIAILSAMMLGGLSQAGRARKRDATKFFVRRLSDAILEAYEAFEDTAPSIDLSPAPNPPGPPLPLPTALLADPSFADGRAYKTEAIRYRLREMLPDSWADVQPPNPYASAVGHTYARYKNQIRLHNLARIPPPADPDPSPMYEDAECLYMIITQSGMFPDLLMELLPNQIGDVDDDGANEFLDAWGNPIAFLRWAPGYVSDTFPHPDPNIDPLRTTPRRDHTQAQIADTINRRDPLDLSNIDPHSYALIPLIYSAGPDGSGGPAAGGPSPYGLVHRAGGWPNTALRNICLFQPNGPLIGAPRLDPANPTAHIDNITNFDLMFE